MESKLKVTAGNPDLLNLFEIELIQNGFSEVPISMQLKNGEYQRREVTRYQSVGGSASHIVLIWREQGCSDQSAIDLHR